MTVAEPVFVAGHRGLAGSALVRRLRAAGRTNLVLRTHDELDLSQPGPVRAFFARERPRSVFLAAAKVGGILANSQFPADFARINLEIQTTVIHEAHRAGVERLVFLGSSCIYPRDCPQPIREDSLLTGPLEETNRAYAIAKIAGIEMCRAYNAQHGTRYVAAMPTNLYGPGDNYDLQSAHVLPALIRKAHEAKTGGRGAVTLWGTGTPRREFLYSDDMADACIALHDLPAERFDALFPNGATPLVNVGCGEDLTIRELAGEVAKAVGFAGGFEHDASKPDGTPRKLLDIGRIRALGWTPKVGLQEGLALAYADFLARQAA